MVAGTRCPITCIVPRVPMHSADCATFGGLLGLRMNRKDRGRFIHPPSPTRAEPGNQRLGRVSGYSAPHVFDSAQRYIGHAMCICLYDAYLFKRLHFKSHA